MKTTGATAHDMLVNELTKGRWLVSELESQLNSASGDLCKSLAQQILACFDKSISMAKLNASCPNLGAVTDSPCSDSSDLKPALKKKKTQHKCTNQVKLGSGPEAEGPLEDGHSWRKYGQKEILGAKHPRGYYRCTHRNTQGCLAMKQVQRSDDNPAIFQVTYRGTHTCHLKSSSAAAQLPAAGAGAGTTSSLTNPGHHHNKQLLLSFQTNLKVETDSLDSKYHQEPSCSSLFFSSTPIDGTPASTLDNCFKRSFNDAFISPATPESNFTEIVSGVSSSSSPCMWDDLDFLLQPSTELDAEFDPFDAMSFFS